MPQVQFPVPSLLPPQKRYIFLSHAWAQQMRCTTHEILWREEKGYSLSLDYPQQETQKSRCHTHFRPCSFTNKKEISIQHAYQNTTILSRADQDLRTLNLHAEYQSRLKYLFIFLLPRVRVAFYVTYFDGWVSSRKDSNYHFIQQHSYETGIVQQWKLTALETDKQGFDSRLKLLLTLWSI